MSQGRGSNMVGEGALNKPMGGEIRKQKTKGKSRFGF